MHPWQYARGRPAIMNMNRKILLAAILLLLSASFAKVSGQNKIEGIVLSKQTGEPLEMVNVFEDGKEGRTLYVTSEDGKFHIESGKKNSLRLGFRRIGYFNNYEECKAGATLVTVRLSEELNTSEEIIVTGESRAHTDLLNTFHITSGLNSVDELISRASGVALMRRGNFGSEPVIRGLNSDRMSVRLDGMKIQPACTDKMDPVTSYAETGNLESISLSKGAFGDDGCFSSCSGIDMKLKDAGTADRFSATGSINGGFLSVSKGIRLEGKAELKSESFGNFTNVTYRSNQDYKDGRGDEIFYSGFNKINISNSSTYKTGVSSSLKADILYDYAWDIGYPALTMDVKDAEAIIAGVQYNTLFRNSFAKELESKIYYNKITHIMDDSQRDNRIKMDMPGWTNTSGAYVRSALQLGSADIEAKAEGIVSNANAEMTMYIPGQGFPMYMVTWPDVRKKELSLSLSAKQSIGSGLMASVRAWGGPVNSDVRSEIGLSELRIFYPGFGGTDSRFAGGIYAGAEAEIAKNIITSLNLSYSVRDFTVSEQYAFYIYNRFDSYDYVGNPYLDPERSAQLELGVTLNTGNVAVKTSFFGYYIEDYIVGVVDSSLSPMTENSNGVKFYENITGARILGFEQTADFVVSDKIQIANTIQYTYGTDDSGGFLPQMPPLMGMLSARYKTGIFTFQGEGVWAAAQNNVNADYGETRTPSYAVFNLRASADMLTGLSLDAGVENIFDVYYYEHLDWLKTPRPGINVYLSFRTRF